MFQGAPDDRWCCAVYGSHTRQHSCDQPHCITDYNCCIGGWTDQHLESVLAIRRTFKWYKKIFQFVLQSALSAHKLSQHGGTKKDFMMFLHDCVTVMISMAPCLTTSPSAGLESVTRLTWWDTSWQRRNTTGKTRKNVKKEVPRMPSMWRQDLKRWSSRDIVGMWSLPQCSMSVPGPWMLPWLSR